VDDAVGRADVSGRDFGAVDEDGAARGPDRHILALHCREHLHVHEVLGVHVAARHVIREQVHELRLVRRLEKVGEDVRGERGERLVGWGEDGERALARERGDEVGSLERGDEGGEVRRGGGEVHDVLLYGRHTRRHEHSVDDVDDAVGRSNIRSGDCCIVDLDARGGYVCHHILALYRLDRLPVLEIFGEDSSTRNDVVRQQLLQRLHILWVQQ